MAKTPKIRFKEFKEDWEEIPFANLYKKAVQKNDLTYDNQDIISVANMYYAPNPLVTDREYLKTYNIFLCGDIAFEGHSNKEYAYGRFVENTVGNGIISHVFKVFRPTRDYDLDYWKYAINEERLMRRHLAVSTKSSTMMKELRDDDFLKEKTFVPMLPEQKMIGKLLKTVDNLIKYYERILPSFDILIKSRFNELFGKDFDNAVKLEELCERITKGTTPTTAGFSFIDEGINFVKIESITEGGEFIKDKLMHVSDECHASFKRSQLKEGDILFSIAGAIGRTAIVSPEILPANTNQALAIIRLKKDVINLDYLIQVLHSEYVINQYVGLKRGAAQVNLSLENVSNFKIPVPDKRLQEEFAEFVKQVDKSRLLYIHKLNALKDIKESLLESLLVVKQ